MDMDYHQYTRPSTVGSLDTKCTNCDKIFSRKDSLKRHLEKFHGIKFEYDRKHNQSDQNYMEYVFDTSQDFMQWKSNMELKTLSSYGKQTLKLTLSTKYQYYECSRSGTYVPKEERKRRLKSQSSSKIGRRCPSRIVVHERDKIFVKFFNKHEGHEMDLEHVRLPKTIRESAADKLKEGISMNQIIDDIREETNSSKVLSRRSLLTKKDLYNIKRDYNIENYRPQVNSVSVSVEHKGKSSKKKGMINLIEHLPNFKNQSENRIGEIDMAHQFIEAFSAGVYDEEGRSEINNILDKLLSRTHQLNLNQLNIELF